jgi:hypothetical protein
MAMSQPPPQNPALNALVFLCKHVLKLDLGDFSQFTRAKRPRKLPVVLTPDEVARLIAPCALTFRSPVFGLRFPLSLSRPRLRVKDLDFGYQQIVVRDGSRSDWQELRQIP